MLHFQSNESVKNVPITIVDDSLEEPPETFSVRLEAVDGSLTVQEPSSITITILDNVRGPSPVTGQITPSGVVVPWTGQLFGRDFRSEIEPQPCPRPAGDSRGMNCGRRIWNHCRTCPRVIIRSTGGRSLGRGLP